MAAKAIRNMQAPAYCPVVFGWNAVDHRGVVVEVKNTMVMEFIPMVISPEEDVDMGIDPSVEVAMGMPDMPSVPDMDIDIESMAFSAVGTSINPAQLNRRGKGGLLQITVSAASCLGRRCSWK